MKPETVMPEFYAPLENLTATQGRDVQFTCVVNHLGDYRVSNPRNYKVPISGKFLLNAFQVDREITGRLVYLNRALVINSFDREEKN